MIANELAINILNSAEEDQCTIHQIGPPLMTTFLGIAMNKSRYIWSNDNESSQTFFWRLFNETTDKQSSIEIKCGWHKADFGGTLMCLDPYCLSSWNLMHNSNSNARWMQNSQNENTRWMKKSFFLSLFPPSTGIWLEH